jgi:pimeloyl-ACP methyl ester carboxylesterase
MPWLKGVAMNTWDRIPLPSTPSTEHGHMVALDGRQTHYLTCGSGPPLILVHGYFYDCHMWSRNIARLSEQYTVYAVDLWGAGLSCRGPLGFSYRLFSEQLRLFMDELGIERAALAGQGMGGGTIMALAAAHPERVERMVLVDTAGLPDTVPWTARLMRAPILALPLFSIPGVGVRRAILKGHFVGAPEILDDAYLNEILAFHRIRGTSRCLLDMLRAEFFHSLGDEIQQLRDTPIPALIVWGELDDSNPMRQARKLNELLPDSRLVVLKNAGHVSNADQPTAFNQAALEFLALGRVS